MRTNPPTFDPSQTALECSAYCSTIGKILEVTMRCARLKLWSISWRVNVMLCSNFSSSSVSDKGRAVDVLDRDMLPMMMLKIRGCHCFPARRSRVGFCSAEPREFLFKRPRLCSLPLNSFDLDLQRQSNTLASNVHHSVCSKVLWYPPHRIQVSNHW